MKRSIPITILLMVATANMICYWCGVWPSSVTNIIAVVVLIMEAYFLGEIQGESKECKKYLDFLEEEIEFSKKTEKELRKLAEEIASEKNNKK